MRELAIKQSSIHNACIPSRERLSHGGRRFLTSALAPSPLTQGRRCRTYTKGHDLKLRYRQGHCQLEWCCLGQQKRPPPE